MNKAVLVRRGVILVAVGGVAVLAWMPFPPLQHATEPWMPEWLKQMIVFFGQQDFLCNVSAFFILAVVVQGLFRGVGLKGRLRCAGALGALVVTLECGQLFLPHRFFDLKDIGSGLLGVAAGSLPWFIAGWRASRSAADGV